MSGARSDEETRRISRDRILLYLGSLDIPAVEGLGLAVDSIGRSGLSSTEEAMESLWEVLSEHRDSVGSYPHAASPVSSVPPLKRSVMVSEEMDLIPWKTALIRALRSWRDDLMGVRR